MKPKQAIGILGGTFDPIHYGHLKIAEALLKKLPFSEIRFLPNQIPPHREKPKASLPDRINMIKLAIAENPKFKLDLTEAHRPGPSYMIDTLKSLHDAAPKECLALIIGADAFLNFNSWHRYLDILNYAHLLIINRPEVTGDKNPEFRQALGPHFISAPEELLTKPAGLIYKCTLKPIPISATHIREKLLQKVSTSEDLPRSVSDYINTHGLYQN